MDTKSRVDQSGLTESIYCDSIKKSDKGCAAVESMEVGPPSSPPLAAASPPLVAVDNGCSSLGPITPYPNKECADLMSNFSSPLTLVSSPPSIGSNSDSDQTGISVCTSKDDDGPCTPREGVFDPFAPGPDKLMLAPHCMKNAEKTRTYVARRLNFVSFTTHNEHAKECVSEAELEKVYNALLEAIITKEAEDILAEIFGSESRDLSPGEPTTPTSPPRLTGIAESCPGAPLKPVRKLRTVDLSLCRKLEFDF